MNYKYYPNIIKYIKQRLQNKFPKVKSKEDLNNIPANLLWMMDTMQSFDDMTKRGRWIGYIMAHAEMLGILTNKQSRKLSKKDSKKGFI
jgi:hypothetical protein